ncbi:hypothetical protein RAS1_43220 [Phycisphaerae bacterium RAS1]|nr:hypothetical protein RAS1_43220 [Phycisphaerae bacterium RAS1]
MSYWTITLVLAVAAGSLALLRTVGQSVGGGVGMLSEYERLLRESREHRLREMEKEDEGAGRK